MKLLNSFLTSLNTNNISFKKLSPEIHDVSGTKRKCPLILFPENKEQVKIILDLANKYLIPIHPISCGKNWGFGSILPIQDNVVVCSLEKLKSISNFDTTLGNVVIEPGVTQQELSDFLKNSMYYLDVTGASADSSIIGNSLERGIAYNTLRVETISNFEVITPAGHTIRTGFNALIPPINSTYSWGIGPSLDGLFFQSNYGIITSAQIKLLKKPECMRSFFITIKNNQDLLDFCQKLHPLLQDGILTCIPHIFNKERLFPGICPLAWKYFNNNNINKSKEDIEKIVRSNFRGEWFAAGNLKGTTHQVDYASKQLKKLFNNNYNVMFFGKWESMLTKLISILPFFHDQKSLLASTDVIKGLTCGIPTDLTLPSIHWPIENCSDYYFNKDIDTVGDCGFMYLTPMATYNISNIKLMLDLTIESFSRYSFCPAITLNAIKPDVMEGVISVHFNKNCKEDVIRAHECIKNLTNSMIKHQMPPYRMHIDMMNIWEYDHDYQTVLQNIKTIFDPNGILSPGRYIPVSKKLSLKLKATG